MIEIRDLKYAYSKEDVALKGVSFDIPDNSWVSIIGHNGSGKSTISKLLVGLIEPQKGEIIVDGITMNEKNAPEIRKNVGIVFQNPDNQFVGVDVEHDIAFGLENLVKPHDEMHEIVAKYASSVGMIDKLKREPHSLSGGEKQRVAIAGILSLDQKYVILDEATSMLDPEGVEDVVSLIKSLRADYNKTVITITHDLNLAALSDKVIVLKDGVVIADAEPMEIFKDADMLKSSNLNLPFSLDLINAVSKDEKLSNNKELVECLWEFHSQK